MADIQSAKAEIRRGKKERRRNHRMKLAAGGAIRIAHYDVIDDVITRKLQEIEKNGDHLAA